jgi:hypothetical protein
MQLPLEKNSVNVDQQGFLIEVYKVIKALNNRPEPYYLCEEKDRGNMPLNAFYVVNGKDLAERTMIEFARNETRTKNVSFLKSAFPDLKIRETAERDNTRYTDRRILLFPINDETVFMEFTEDNNSSGESVEEPKHVVGNTVEPIKVEQSERRINPKQQVKTVDKEDSKIIEYGEMAGILTTAYIFLENNNLREGLANGQFILDKYKESEPIPPFRCFIFRNADIAQKAKIALKNITEPVLVSENFLLLVLDGKNHTAHDLLTEEWRARNAQLISVMSNSVAEALSTVPSKLPTPTKNKVPRSEGGLNKTEENHISQIHQKQEQAMATKKADKLKSNEELKKLFSKIRTAFRIAGYKGSNTIGMKDYTYPPTVNASRPFELYRINRGAALPGIEKVLKKQFPEVEYEVVKAGKNIALFIILNKEVFQKFSGEQLQGFATGKTKYRKGNDVADEEVKQAKREMRAELPNKSAKVKPKKELAARKITKEKPNGLLSQLTGTIISATAEEAINLLMELGVPLQTVQQTETKTGRSIVYTNLDVNLFMKNLKERVNNKL